MIATIALLTQVASSLPSSASALEGSIPALERAISALDSKAEALSNSSASLEPWSWVFTAFVVIGVAMEFWVIWHEHREDMETWALTFFGLSRSLRPSAKRLVVEYLSVALVAGGIIGELAIGVGIASRNHDLRGVDAQLRAKNEELRSKSDQLLALVTQEAGNAVDDADKAHRLARGTRTQVVSFGRSIIAARREATAAEKDREAALERTQRLEAELSWRTVTPQQTAEIRKALMGTGLLLPLRGWNMSFTVPTGCAECEEYANELMKTIDGLGADVSVSGLSHGIFTKMPTGVILSVNPTNRTGRIPLFLLNVLHTNGVEVKGVTDKGVGEHAIDFVIGIKPHASP